ncbi:MAG: hypothetical protein ACKO8Q_10495, partial [Bacteroidota bacterium]
NIKGALSFPLIHNTFLYGQPGTNKSTVHKCIQLISDNCFSFPLIKNFNALGPQANINSVLYDCNKPLSFNFQFYSSIGEISFAYQINKLDNSPHGHVTGFQITYKNTPVFFQSNKNASIFPAGLLHLLKSAQDFISTEKIKGLDAESSSLNTDLLQPLTELFDTTISNFEWVSSGLTQIKPSPCKTRVHESHPNHFMPDFFQMFPNDVNFDLAEFGGKFVHNAYYALPSFFNFNSFKSKKCDTHFSGIILHSDQKSNFYFNHLLKQPRKVQDLLDELHLPCVEKIPVVDQMGGVIGNQLMVMNSQKKLIPITQESSKNQQAILCVYDLMNSLEDIDFRNSTK